MQIKNKTKLLISIIGLILLTSTVVSAKNFYASGATKKKQITLTFDDGPGPMTPQFLDLLDKYQVKATFFMLGELVEFRGSMAKDVANRGHEIGSHTMTHKNYLARMKQIMKETGETKDHRPRATSMAKKELLADMTKSHKVIEEAIGHKIRFCRMPHGVDGPWVRETAEQAGFTLVNWTYGADWTTASAEELIPSYVKAIQPGAIFLLHDGGTKREKTLKITEELIKAAKEKGYEIVPLAEILNLKDK